MSVHVTALTLQEIIGWRTSQSPLGEGTPEDGSSTSTVHCTGYAGKHLSSGVKHLDFCMHTPANTMGSGRTCLGNSATTSTSGFLMWRWL